MTEIKQAAAVIAGGGFGSLLRFMLSGLIRNIFPGNFPIGTLVINISAAFILGYIVGYADQRQAFSVGFRLFITVGFCGGFSTFSAFSLESVRLFQTGQHASLVTYVLLSVGLCIVFTYLGLTLSNNISGAGR